MIQRYSELGPLEEALALTTTSCSKNIILGALELKGSLDDCALKKSLKIVAEHFPHLKSTLKEIKQGARYRLVRDHEKTQEIPFHVWSAEGEVESGSILETLVSCLKGSLEGDQEIFGGPLIEIHLIKFKGQRNLIACIVKHVMADAVTLIEIAREFIENYHKIVTGRSLPSGKGGPAASTLNKRIVRQKKTTLSDYSQTLRQAAIPHMKCALPEGSGASLDRNEHYVKRLMSFDEADLVISQARMMRASFVDYLVAGMTMTIERWNKARNVETLQISAALTANMKGRFINGGCTNNDSIMYFRFGPEARCDAQTLVQHAYRTRMRLYRNQMDLKYSKGLAKFNGLLSVFPFHIRQKVLLRILKNHQTSFALGFMGVLWPEGSGRRVSADSSLTSTGGVEITEAHGVAFNIVSRTPLYLAAYFFRKRLNLILSAAAWKFSRDETEEFIDLLVTTLIDPSRVR